jgi:hypothetical protein
MELEHAQASDLGRSSVPERNLVWAALVELLPNAALIIVALISTAAYYGGMGVLAGSSIFLIFALVAAIVGSGFGWFLIGVPVAGCSVSLLRVLLAAGMVSTLSAAAPLCGGDECERNVWPVTVLFSLWLFIPLASAGTLYATQRFRTRQIAETTR